ncbi:MAG TPA: M23 family metallopeptidase [Puia sp.]|nr:M23 family metallopeptidase [Puia sp.]
MHGIKTISCLSLSLFLTCLSSPAQKPISVSYSKDMKGDYQFYCMNNAFCDYVLEISFTALDNLNADHSLPYVTEVKPGNNKLFKLSKINKDAPEKFNYRIGYNKGCMHPAFNPDFTYLLPIAPGKEVQAYEMQNPGISQAGGQDQKDWYVIRLKMNPGDTLYAARRGTVTAVEVDNSQNDEGQASAGFENYIEIVHRDCSFGHYGVLRKNSAFVKPGQFVEAGQPIGLVGGDKYGRGSEARFSVYYNEPRDSSAMEAGRDMSVYWTYIPLQFWTKRNGKGKLKNGANYTSEHTEAVLTQEMNKAEVKKWKAAHAKPVK